MGLGDQLIGSGLARDAWTKRGVKVAFGDGHKILWDKQSETIFRNNPNIAFPGNEHRSKIEWIGFHKGSRGYNRQGDGHWIWNMDWRCTPGELYLSVGEKAAAARHGSGFVVMEPNVETWKSSSPNKDWGFHKYQAIADRLIAAGHRVVQFLNGGPILQGVDTIKTKTFRDAVSIMAHASIYVGPEGGLHHGAAAMGIPGVVLFGGFIPPSVTGYDIHTNMAGSDRFCGSFSSCEHCREAMAAISVDAVYNAARERLSG